MKNRSKNTNADIYEVKITINKNKIKNSARPLILNIYQCFVTNDFKLGSGRDDISVTVSYSNNDILNDRFHFSNIKNIIKNIRNKSIYFEFVTFDEIDDSDDV